MSIDYMAVLGSYFPNVHALCIGDANVYENIRAEGDSVLPSKAELDAAILQHSKDSRIDELSNACRQEIVGGFASDALGTAHIYDAYEVDQLNLVGATTGAAPTESNPDGFITPYAVRPVEQGTPLPKTYKPHTYLQLRKVIADGVQFKLLRLQKFNDKRNFIVLHCDTVEAVEAVTWSSVEPTV